MVVPDVSSPGESREEFEAGCARGLDPGRASCDLTEEQQTRVERALKWIGPRLVELFRYLARRPERT